MPIKNNRNKFTEKCELVLAGTSVAFSTASVVDPKLAPWVPFLNLLSLPFAAHNNDLIKKQIQILIDEFNKLETEVQSIKKANEEEKRIFTINAFKVLDYAVKEKSKEKIRIYARILSDNINSKDIFTEGDYIDIQLDIINSLKKEDILLLRYIIDYSKEASTTPFAFEFKEEDLEAYVVNVSNEEETVNKYALKHLVNLGLLYERFATTAEFEQTEQVIFNDRIVAVYSLTQRLRSIFEKVMCPQKSK